MAENSLHHWVGVLAPLGLPLLKQSCQDLQQIGGYENIPMAKFSNIALTDPGLTLTLLRAACALPRSRLQDEIHTVDAAAMKLGEGRIKTTIEAMRYLEDTVDEESRAIYMQLLSRAYHSAYQAYGMARERVDLAPEELFTAAMLHDLGALMLLVHGQGILLEFDNLDDEAEQQRRLGMSLRQLSQALAREWRLSSFIQHSLEPYDGQSAINPRLYEIHLARELSLTLQQGWETAALQALIEKIARHLHCDAEEALAEVRDNAIHCAEETTFYGVVPAAASLPDLDQAQRASFIEGTMVPVKSLLRGRTDAVPTASLAPQQPFSPLNPAVLDQVIQGAKAQLADGFELASFMELIKRGFVDGLKLNRAFFAMLDQERRYLVSRFMFGNDSGLRNLRIPLRDHNLFQRLLDQPQALRCQAQNRHKILPLLPKEFYKLINTDEFFIMTLCARGKALGIVYADRYGNDYGLDATDYEKLCQLCRLLAKGFERLGR